MIWSLLFFSALSAVVLLALMCATLVFMRDFFRKRKKRERPADPCTIIGFFHPYCNAGGGGERVLWCAVKAIQTKYPNAKTIVYTGDVNAAPNEITKKVYQRFNVTLPREVEFVYLHKRKWIEDSMYPSFTLLGQALGSVLLGFEALYSYVPDIYIDTMGYAFTLPLFSYIGGCQTISYVHYPTITRDMLRKVSSRTVAINNRASVARSPVFSSAKVIYYKIFSNIYGFCGRYSQSVMVNSSWTEDHINYLWERPLATHRVFPPCDTSSLKALPMAPDFGDSGEIKIVSVGQYRPEKDHPMQLKAMYELRQKVSEEVWDRLKLVFVGSCRDSVDDARVKDMMDLSKHLSLENNVVFKVNVSYEDLKKELSSSVIGLHAMWNEHFGIGVVECMAAGLIMVAHRSGGPKADIIEESEGSRNGFLASDEVEYAETIARIIKMTPASRNKIREAARSSVDRFSVEEFENGFLRTLEPFFQTQNAS